MRIEVRHDPERLICRAVIKVRNPRQADIFLSKLCDTKRERGYKLRHIPDLKKGSIELGTRNTEGFRIATRALKDGGFI